MEDANIFMMLGSQRVGPMRLWTELSRHRSDTRHPCVCGAPVWLIGQASTLPSFGFVLWSGYGTKYPYHTAIIPYNKSRPRPITEQASRQSQESGQMPSST